LALSPELNPNERVKIEKEAELELEKIKTEQRNKELEAEKKAIEDKKKQQEEFADFLQDIGEEVLDGIIERSKRREEILSQEIDQSKELEDQLREQANTGNAIASQSLAAQQQVTAEKERLRQEEQRKQQAFEEFKLILQATDNFMDQGESFTTASSKAFALVKSFVQALAAAPGFIEGTKGKLGDENKALKPGKDGHLIWADSNEMILNPTQVSALEKSGIYTTDDVIRYATMTMDSPMYAIPQVQSMTHQNINVDFTNVVNEIKELRQEIRNKPEYSLHPDFKMGILNGLIEQKKQGNKITRTITRLPR